MVPNAVSARALCSVRRRSSPKRLVAAPDIPTASEQGQSRLSVTGRSVCWPQSVFLRASSGRYRMPRERRSLSRLTRRCWQIPGWKLRRTLARRACGVHLRRTLPYGRRWSKLSNWSSS